MGSGEGAADRREQIEHGVESDEYSGNRQREVNVGKFDLQRGRRLAEFQRNPNQPAATSDEYRSGETEDCDLNEDLQPATARARQLHWNQVERQMRFLPGAIRRA